MNIVIEQLVARQTGFWREHLHLTEGAGGRLHVAWPLLRYDGWQVSFALDPGTSGDGVWRLSDNGTTLKLLNDMGASGKVFTAHVKSRCELYAIAQENGELTKLKTSPFTPAELQLFAEAIQALSFLAYRAEPAHEGWGIARRNFHLLIYNPAAGRWTEDNIAFGAHIADHFLPYMDTVQIEAALHQTA